MIIQAVDCERRLFSVWDILPADLAKQVQELNWLNLSYGKQPGQETWSRRLVNSDTGLLKEVNEYYVSIIDQLGDACGVEFKYPSTGWWLDEPGFTVSVHTDGHLPCSMQIFWVMPTEEYGTKFYNDKGAKDVRFAPKGVPNTGYIMLNLPDNNGSQPLHWHGMLNPVPKDTIRVCSYTTFGTYENK